MKELNLGVKIHDQLVVSSLLVADGIALIADAEEHLQRMLDCLSHWCSQNKMSVNISKTKVVHFGKKNKALTDFEFKLGDSILEIYHKYLGVILNEFLDFTETANVLSESTYSKMYKSKLVPIMDYCSSVWGFKLYSKPDTTLHVFIIGLLSFS